MAPATTMDGKPRTKHEIDTSGERPRPLPIHVEGIPPELRERGQWVGWRYELKEKDGKRKWTKVPVNLRTGALASSRDRSTWMDFDQALESYSRNGCDGIGFVFSAGDPYCGVDLDDAFEPESGSLKPWAATIVQKLDTYMELSPSGTGVKLYLKAKKPGDKCRRAYEDGEVEIYDSGRFFVVTGILVDGFFGAPINDRQQQLDAIYRELFPQTQQKSAATAASISTADATDEQIIQRASEAKNGDKFERLWAGDTGDFGGNQSRADLALCDLLAFWTGPDPARIDALFRKSGLFRCKWDERRGEQTYGQRTVEKALRNRTLFYTPGKNGDGNHTGNGFARRQQSDESEIHLTDLGNARRVVQRHGTDLRYSHPWRSWLVWDDRRWAEDVTAEVARRVKETQGALYRRCADQIRDLGEVGEDDDRKKELARLMRLLKHVLSWEDARAIDRCLKLITSEPGIPVLPSQLDADPFMLNVVNGTIDLRTGQLREHRRVDLITKLAPVEYWAGAQCPLWHQCLNRWLDGNNDLSDYLQRVIGYCLVGDVREQVLWFFYGMGANGKSTFLGTILAMLGDYAIQAVSELLLVKHNESHPTERADLFGRRLVATIETEEGKRMAEALMKQLTGGDKIRARKMRQDFFEFQPSHKIILAANHKPAIRGADYAVWRRIKLVPFNVTITPEEKDNALPDKLKAELPGILAWAVRGCLDWQQHGLGEPDVVRQATEEYQAEQDLLAGFIAQMCFIHSTAKIQASKLFTVYQDWSGDKTTTQKGFTQMMAQKGYPSIVGTGNRSFYEGVGMAD